MVSCLLASRSTSSCRTSGTAVGCLLGTPAPPGCSGGVSARRATGGRAARGRAAGSPGTWPGVPHSRSLVEGWSWGPAFVEGWGQHSSTRPAGHNRPSTAATAKAARCEGGQRSRGHREFTAPVTLSGRSGQDLLALLVHEQIVGGRNEQRAGPGPRRGNSHAITRRAIRLVVPFRRPQQTSPREHRRRDDAATNSCCCRPLRRLDAVITSSDDADPHAPSGDCRAPHEVLAIGVQHVRVRPERSARCRDHSHRPRVQRGLG